MRATYYFLLSAALCLPATASFATENGNEDFPIGVNTVLPGVEPPAGATEYYNYTNFFDAGSQIGDNGQKSAPGFHVNVVANAFRVEHSWDLKLGAFWFTSGLVLPLVNLNIAAAGQHQSDTTFGDLDIQNYVNWANATHTVFAFGGLDVYAPTGHYNKNDMANIGLGYTTLMPTTGVTWFVSKRLQLSAQTEWQVPFENGDTHYQSGASFNIDYAADYNFIKSMPRLFFGIQGYAFQQLTPDREYGQIYEDGYYGRTLAIGPQIRYDLKGGGIALKYTHDFDVANRSKGEKVWLQFAVPVNL